MTFLYAFKHIMVLFKKYKQLKTWLQAYLWITYTLMENYA